MAGVTHPDTATTQSHRHPGLVGKRVALFTGAYNHIADGVTLTLNRLVAYLERHGAEVLVFAPTVDEPAVEHAGKLVPVPSIPFPGRPDYHLAKGLTRSVRARIAAFDPMLFHVATPDYLGISALRLARKRGTQVVASFHTHFSSYLKYYRLGLLEDILWKYGRWFYGRCTHIYVPSTSMAEVLRERGITDGVRIWKRGVDLDRFNPTHRSEGWRRTLGIHDDEVVITFVGRLVWEKGLDVFARVIEGLRARGLAHRSVIVGNGPVYDDLAARLPETIFTGYLEGDDLSRAYASSDVFLFPSETETFGNVTLEAMASGLPTVCADATGSRSIVLDGVTGFLASPGDADAFTGYTERLVTDAALRRRLGHNALVEAQSYRWDAVLARIACYYEEILNPQREDCGDGLQGTHEAPGLSVSKEMLLSSS